MLMRRKLITNVDELMETMIERGRSWGETTSFRRNEMSTKERKDRVIGADV